MDSRISFTASSLEGFLLAEDKKDLGRIESLYNMHAQSETDDEFDSSSRALEDEMGRIISKHPRIHLYRHEAAPESQMIAAMLLSTLRRESTEHEEFVSAVVRAYQMMFPFAFKGESERKIKELAPTGVYAVDFIPDVYEETKNAVLCVLLRGALLPSMVISKEAESATNEAIPFALFKIKRDESKTESNMEYILDLASSSFDIPSLDGKDWIFADPMNATSGSLHAVISFLEANGARPRSVKVINVIAALKGVLRTIRAIPEAEVYTLGLDPVLNDAAYILPGLGDAGDRLYGKEGEVPRTIPELIDSLGSLKIIYRKQVEEIEKALDI